MSRALWQLAGVFAPLSLAMVGGGQAVIGDMQRQVVTVHGWMSAAQFVNDFGISRMAPGPGSLLVTLIGWQVAGLAGALVATLAIYAPTTVMMVGLAHVWSRHRGRRWQRALEAGLRPVAAGLILAAGVTLVLGLEGGTLARLVALAATLALLLTRASPILLIGGGAAVFVALHPGAWGAG